MKVTARIKFCSVIFGIMSAVGCQAVDPYEDAELQPKRKGLPESQWHRILPQDLAIVLPRSKVARIAITDEVPSGRPVFQPEWMETVGEIFAVTDVRGALDQNQIDDWQIVSVRIDPCSPIGKVPGRLSHRYCWPEVRIVWQPIVFDYNAGWTWFEAFSDDRAIHTTYRVHTKDTTVDSATLVQEITEMLSDNLRPSDETITDFESIRDQTIRQLLGETMALRHKIVSLDDYERLGIRAEMKPGFGLGVDALFLRKLLQLLDRFTAPDALHTLTAFSLPPGRDPEGINSWVFLSFKPSDYGLVRSDIEVASSRTGQTLITLTHNETVAAGEADFEVKAMLESDTDAAEELRERVLLDSSDVPRLREIVNDPNQTLVANTTCGTCHSFNRDAFNFHNLSYLSEGDITIAPRVVNDVRYNLGWLLDQR